MVEAFIWGAVGGSALLIGALVAYQLAPSRKVIAVVMALGTGLLIGSVSFELVDEDQTMDPPVRFVADLLSETTQISCPTGLA